MKIKPVSKNIVLKKMDPEEKTKSGLFIPDTAREEKLPEMAQVIAIGESKKITERGIKVGDKVFYSKYAGTEVELEGVKYTIISVTEVLAKVE